MSATDQSYITDGVTTIHFNVDMDADSGENDLHATLIPNDGVLINTQKKITQKQFQITAIFIRGTDSPKKQYYDFVALVEDCTPLEIFIEMDDTIRNWKGAVKSWNTNMPSGETERLMFSFEFWVHSSNQELR